MSSLRLLPPRATLQLHSRQLQHRLLSPSLRYSSTSPPPKPRVLEKPERFNPPSHPSRLRSRGPKYYGPALSDREREMQKTKRYPHMMPPEGSFMHWFLTDRTIHLWITIVGINPPTKDAEHLADFVIPSDHPRLPHLQHLAPRLPG